MTMEPAARVTWTVADGVATVTLDNPPVNALGGAAFDELDRAAHEMRTAGQVRAVVLTGAGDKAFMAGADINEFRELQAEPGAIERRMRKAHRVFESWAQLPMPVVAAVQAPAVGGGLEVALLCDFIVADRGTRLGLPEVRLGLIPAGGGTQRLARRVGSARAKEILMLGRTVRAVRAYDWGLVDRLADEGTAVATAQAFAAELAAMPAVAVRAIKHAVDRGLETDLSKGIDIETEGFLAAFGSEDFHEGLTAFLEHRKPTFGHR
jgi:enoyl-CoA hydratase/carnithine racemase